jgi:hypothetical protein
MFHWGFSTVTSLNIVEGEKKGLHRTGKIKKNLEALPTGVLGPVPRWG